MEKTSGKITEDIFIFLPESIVVRMKDQILFRPGSIGIDEINIQVFDRLVKMMRDNNWNIMVDGHSAQNEVGEKSRGDAYTLSSERAFATRNFSG